MKAEGPICKSCVAASARFDLPTLAAALPERAETLLIDRYLVDRPESSARIFRVYRGTPAHFHRQCDEHLLVLSGRGTFWMDNEASEGEFGPGTFLFFPRGTIHALPSLREEPVVFLAIDTPRRAPDDVIFVDPRMGTAAEFVREMPAPVPNAPRSGV